MVRELDRDNSAESIGDELEPESVLEESSGDADSGQEGIHRDDLFHLLQVSRRRDIIRYLKEKPDEIPLELGKISAEIAALEEDKHVNEVTAKERKNVYVQLYQRNLETLEDEDVIVYDHPEIVDYGENFDIVARYVEDSFEDPDELVTSEDIFQDGSADSVARYLEEFFSKLNLPHVELIRK